MPGSLQLLQPAQARVLWEAALRQLGGDDAAALLPHAAALMRAASQACQSLAMLSRTAVTGEERLLVDALAQVRELCGARGLVALDLAMPEELDFLQGSEPPLIAGQRQLTSLQQQLQQQCWPGAQLLVQPLRQMVEPALARCANLDAEITACARWCREQLHEDGSRRLLVVSAWQDPGAHAQGALLWRALAGTHGAPEEHRQGLLAVEGGEPLHHQTLVADALSALAMHDEWIDTKRLLQLLRSPYLDFGSIAECAELASRLGAWSLARWRPAALREALSGVAARLPAAAALRAWLDASRALVDEAPRRSATAWAGCFSACLHRAGFASRAQLDSRDAQRLARWGELLDEFAGLDAAVPPLTAAAALQSLQRLAQQATHQGATGDAAITFTTLMQDPVAPYDGIWVMGLSESRWPRPPRPDPYVSLAEQRRCEWPQAGVTQRLQEAQWLQQCWQGSTANLVLSFARQEGDVRHRPSALLVRAGWAWMDPATADDRLPAGLAAATTDRVLPVVSALELAQPLRGGVERLRVQQECAFHAQAQWRLGAEAQATFTDGIPARLRGMLLHCLLEGLWGELKDQQHLLALTPTAEEALVKRHWEAALHDNRRAGVDWLAPGVLELEWQRTARLVHRVLMLERERAPFAVQWREHEIPWRSDPAVLNLRIDRIDATAQGSRLLVDYKSGAAGSMRLHKGEARPLQLAAYVLALAAAGHDVDGALLLSLKPAQLGFAGAADADEPVPRGVKPVTDWPQALQQWQGELHQLLSAHLAGNAVLATSPRSCDYCHLPAFCRRRAIGDAAPAEEEGSDE